MTDDNKSQSDLLEVSISGQSTTTGTGNNSTTDPKYLCPITNRIMRNPVTAFNGVTYEKSAIVKFWRENGHAFENKDEKN